MGIMERPAVTVLADGAKCWAHTYESFELKAYVPVTEINGQVNNYTFRAPLLLVLEENRQTMEEAIAFAKNSGLARVASDVDASVLFVYPTCEGGWEHATESLYADIIAEVKMDPRYADGICEVHNFFTREFQGFFIRGAKFRADIYSFGKSADYVAKHLLKTLQGEFLWGPGEITPACVSMQGLSVMPQVERKDIAVLSVGNSSEINQAFAGGENVLVKDAADYYNDFYSFVRKFKMWCGNMEIEPNFDELCMVEERGSVTVKTSPDNRSEFKNDPTHEVGYFAYYNQELPVKGKSDKKVPLFLGFHGGGDSAMFLTFVSGWWAVAHKHNFLYVALENHQNVTATEVQEIVAHLCEKYNVDSKRMYAGGFSMGSGKTWDMFQEYPETFAGLIPASALFPVYNNPFSAPLGDRLNKTIAVPIFYSGGEESPLPELPCQDASGVERIRYAAEVNKLKKKFDICFEEKEQWEDPIWGVPGDRMEVLHDDVRNSDLTIHYYDSEDGVCRTAFASISGQGHEMRQHTCDQAWQFISQFTK